MSGEPVRLNQSEWIIGEQIGSGGFGAVFAAQSDDVRDAVAKFVPKAEGGSRELLFVNLDGVRNVVPIIDFGETGDAWVLVMPRAEQSLRDFIESHPDGIPHVDAIAILSDIATALADLDARDEKVVHRDLKPENVLYLNGRWCLADFGISRYAEATTAPDTHKYAWTWPYAAPERWNFARATPRTDVYSLGVMAYELFTGDWPFAGPRRDDFRDQHLHREAPRLDSVSAPLSSLIAECLFKAVDARPTAANLLARLQRVSESERSPGLQKLEQANRAEVARRAEADRLVTERRSIEQRREELYQAAAQSFRLISTQLKSAIVDAAPTATLDRAYRDRGGWILSLNGALLVLAPVEQVPPDPWGPWGRPNIEVIAQSHIRIEVPENQYHYEGRSHSLWFCDAIEKGQFGWYETAFMTNAVMPERSRSFPYSLSPSKEAAMALSNVMSEHDVARPFVQLIPGELGDFIDFWASLFAEAANGGVPMPHSLPETVVRGKRRT
jgi:serine/threonine-protein kinase